MPGWSEQQEALARIARRQLFFIGGAPRSGTTWLQQILDAHPDVSCRGEGLFLNHLAVPLEKLIAERRTTLEAKNTGLFRHTGGFPLPTPDDAEFLAGTAILLALQAQCAGAEPAAIGEKTPENVFFFPRLLRLFPQAKFIAIARDPRDVLTSAWHFFRHGGDDAAKTDFVRGALPSLAQGARAMIAFADGHPDITRLVTYEQLQHAPAPVVAALFRLLRVDDGLETVDSCLARTSFAAQSGRPAGIAQDGAFHRKGVVGDWRSTLTPAMDAMVVEALGWLFERFGWAR